MSVVRARARLRSLMLAAAVAAVVAWPVGVAAQDEGVDVASDEVGSARLSLDDARRILALAPPQGATPEREADYWLERQRAAFTVGDGAARIAALRRLVELTAKPDQASPYIGYLWREIWRNGSQSEAMEMGEKLVDDKSLGTAARAAYLVQLGGDHASLGERAKARSALARSEAEAARIEGDRSSPGVVFLFTEIERLRSSLLQQEGDFDGAEAAARRSLGMANAEVARLRSMRGANPLHVDRSVRERNAVMARAVWLAVAQGKSAEAELIARTGIRQAQEEATAGTTLGYWYGRLAQAQLAQRRYADAYTSATKAVEVQRESGALPSSDRMQDAQFQQLQALFGLERWKEADGVAAGMLQAAADDPVARARIDSAVLQAILHVRNGRADAGLQRIDGSARYRARNFGEAHPLTVESKAVRAMAYQALRRDRDALSDYEIVFRSLFAPETSFVDAEPAGLRGFYTPIALHSFLSMVAAAYRESPARGVSDGMASDAFRVADRLRASAVQQALIDASARVAIGNPEIAEFARREQDTRRQSRELVAQLNAQLEADARLTREAQERQKAKPDPAEAASQRTLASERRAAIAKSREAVAAADKARGAIVRELAARFPAYGALVNPKPPTLDQVADLLDRTEALVSVYTTPTATFVWFVGSGRGPALHVSPLAQADVRALVAKLRATLDVGDRPSPGSAPVDLVSAHRLYQELLEPFASRLAGVSSLVVATNGDLATIPFAVLVSERPSAGEPAWLVRKVAVTQVSTVAAFAALRQVDRRATAAEAFAGFGDPVYRRGVAPPAPGAVRALVRAGPPSARDTAFTDADYAQLPPLPETRDEIVAIARALGADPGRDTYLGERASRGAALGAGLSGRRVVAFATHGLRPGDLAGLSRPALALSVTQTPGESPLLVLDDVMGMKLDADWVVLSACNTASDDGRAEEALSGLARGFFFAGARSVLVTHWAVETRSAQDLVTRTFSAVAREPGVGRAEALRRAQLEMADGRADPRWRHPFFWAPYALSGDPSR